MPPLEPTDVEEFVRRANEALRIDPADRFGDFVEQVGIEHFRVARGADGALALGSVVTIEPGVYQAGWGGVRVEDDVHLAPEGPQVLTHFTRELVELA